MVSDNGCHVLVKGMTTENQEPCLSFSCFCRIVHETIRLVSVVQDFLWSSKDDILLGKIKDCNPYGTLFAHSYDYW